MTRDVLYYKILFYTVAGTAVILSSLLVLIMMNDHLPTEIGSFPVVGETL